MPAQGIHAWVCLAVEQDGGLALPLLLTGCALGWHSCGPSGLTLLARASREPRATVALQHDRHCPYTSPLSLPTLASSEPSAAAIEAELFCGWANSGCPPPAHSSNGNSSTNSTARLLDASSLLVSSNPFLAASVPVSTATSRRPAATPSGKSTKSNARRMLQQHHQQEQQQIRTGNLSGNSSVNRGVAVAGPRIIQYPSAVYDWHGSSAAAGGAARGLELTVWVNNSNAQVGTMQARSAVCGCCLPAPGAHTQTQHTPVGYVPTCTWQQAYMHEHLQSLHRTAPSTTHCAVAWHVAS